VVALAWIDKSDELGALDERGEPGSPGVEPVGRPLKLVTRAGTANARFGPHQLGPHELGLYPASTALRPGTRRVVEQRRLPRTFLWRRLLAVCTLGAVVALAWGTAEQMFGAAGASRGSQLYVARPGDTIWGIAERFSGGGDPWPLVNKLEAEIGDGTLQPGQVLAVPAQASRPG